MHRSDVLTESIRHRGWTFGAELGVAAANNLAVLLRDCPRLSMIGVDVWEHQPRAVYDDDSNVEDHASVERTARRTLLPFGGRCLLLKMFTTDAARLFADGAFDFVFIDANHSEDAVYQDMLDWTPLVRTGGTVFGHDYSAYGVRPAVDRYLGELESCTGTHHGVAVHHDDIWSLEVDWPPEVTPGGEPVLGPVA